MAAIFRNRYTPAPTADRLAAQSIRCIAFTSRCRVFSRIGHTPPCATTSPDCFTPKLRGPLRSGWEVKYFQWITSGRKELSAGSAWNEFTRKRMRTDCSELSMGTNSNGIRFPGDHGIAIRLLKLLVCELRA